MTVRNYLKDQGLLWFGCSLGLVLAISVSALGAADSGFRVPVSYLLYALALGEFCVVAALVVDYYRRRPVMQDLARVRASGNWRAAQALTEQGTQEQRSWIDLLNWITMQCANELTVVEERRQFYEVFVTRFAHQMKTPVTVMQLLSAELRQWAAEQDDAAQGVVALLDSLDDERDRLSTNLEQILYTARLSAFSLDMHPQAVDVVAVLREAINEHKTAWIRRSLFPRIEVDAHSTVAFTDRKWFLFVVDQILRNTLQYGVKPGSDSSSAVIRVQSDGEATVVTFVDQGIGIPQQDIKRIFDPFFTGSNGRTHSRATGMGLYLVKVVCDLLGHEITVESTENIGTEVTLLIHAPHYLAPAIEKVQTHVTKL